MSAASERAVHVVVPKGFDDPDLTSGGNVFDRHVVAGLTARGWDVHVVHADAAHADPRLSRLPPGAAVLIDGLVARHAPAAIEAEAGRLRIAVLAHMVSGAFPDTDPQELEGERRALRAAHRVIVTSEWTRSEFVRRGLVAPGRITVAPPGTTDTPAARGTPTGRALLCVGVVAPHKGQDVLLRALHALDDTRWTCTIAGSLAAFPAFASRVRAASAGFDDRMRMTGVLHGRELDAAYRRADLVVAPSRVESYGMAVADALRRGIPVVASAVGGIPQAVGGGGGALLVPPGRSDALSAALRRWMTDPALRARLRDEALRTRSLRPRWDEALDRIAAVLEELR